MSIQYLPTINESNIHLPITNDEEITQLTSFNQNNLSKDNYQTDILSKQSPQPSTSDIHLNKTLNKRRKTITLEV
jgi:hypothetical protein